MAVTQTAFAAVGLGGAGIGWAAATKAAEPAIKTQEAGTRWATWARAAVGVDAGCPEPIIPRGGEDGLATCADRARPRGLTARED